MTTTPAMLEETGWGDNSGQKPYPDSLSAIYVTAGRARTFSIKTRFPVATATPALRSSPSRWWHTRRVRATSAFHIKTAAQPMRAYAQRDAGAGKPIKWHSSLEETGVYQVQGERSGASVGALPSHAFCCLLPEPLLPATVARGRRPKDRKHANGWTHACKRWRGGGRGKGTDRQTPTKMLEELKQFHTHARTDGHRQTGIITMQTRRERETENNKRTL